MTTPPAYVLSFTVGGLFFYEGLAMARLRVSGLEWDEAKKQTPRQVLVGSTDAQTAERSAQRYRNEIVGRLRELTDEEIAFFVNAGKTDARALMWVATCRRYRILAEFARDVLDEAARIHHPTIHFGDFNAFLADKAIVADEVDRITKSTRNKLRCTAFKMMDEAGILDRDNKVIQPFISLELRDLLRRNRRAGLQVIPGAMRLK